MSIQQATPIAAFVPVAPDADWETVRVRLTDALTASAVPAWTDHNAADPGITLLELLAYGLADLHYRVAERHFDGWPLEVPRWLADTDRHWYATLPQAITKIADLLATPGPTSAAVLEPEMRNALSRADAITRLSDKDMGGSFSTVDRPAVVALLRSRLVRQVAMEHADLVADVVAAHAERDPKRVTAARVAKGDAAAASELSLALPLWDDEVVALVRRERRRLSREAMIRRLPQVHVLATKVDADAMKDTFGGDGLDPEEAAVALAAAPQPPGLVPEQLEDASGHTRVWPPHPIQALTCEPVTADDYARRARSHPDVGRAWTVSGRLDGIAWNGLRTGTLPTIATDPAAKALTLVVEPVRGDGDDQFLRSVLKVAIGPEVTAPFPDWRNNVNDIEPRRLLCDEVGASLLVKAPVLIQAILVTGVGVDRDAVVDDVRARIAAFFAAGRPETWQPAPPRVVDGPWPRVDQPGGGWLPGDPIRFTEMVEAIVGNPQIHGVEKLAMKVSGDASFITSAQGPLRLPAGSVPVLDEARCLRVRFALTTECGQ